MFEYVTLPNGPGKKRVWTTLLGMTGQAALISLAVLIPVVTPQVIPLAKIDLTYVPVTPRGPERLGGELQRATGPARTVRTLHPEDLVQPTSFLPQAQKVVDEPDWRGPADSAGPVRDSVIGGVPTGALDNFVSTSRVAMPKIAETPVVAQAAPVQVVAPLVRYKSGGKVQLGAPLHRAEPVYPLAAKASHVSGDVELACVVGADGRITEVKVRSGNALLVKAAVDAAWQWVYAPSRLNDVPIEIETILTFHFALR